MTWMLLRQSWWTRERILAVMVDLRTEEMLAKGRRVFLSFSTMRSSSGTYSWFVAAREGTLKEKPWPERMEWVRERTKDSMADWTEERDRSVTSRQAEERERSDSVKGLEEVEAEKVDFKRECRDSRITESGFRRFLKGSWGWSEE